LTELTEKELKVLVILEAYNAVLLGAGHNRAARKELLKNRYQKTFSGAILSREITTMGIVKNEY
jgi:hypothetical protein